MKKTLMAVILIINLMIIFSFLHSVCAEEENDLPEGNSEETEEVIPAPDLSLPDLSGEMVSLETFKGEKVVLLVFWKSDSKEHIRDIPRLKQLCQIEGLEILSINQGDGEDEINTFIDTYEIPYKVLIDADGLAGRDYGLESVPLNIIIDRSGTIVYSDSVVPSQEKVVSYCDVPFKDLYFTIGAPEEDENFNISPGKATLSF